MTLRADTDTVTVDVSTDAADAVVDTLAAFALSGPGGASVALSPKFDPGTSAYTAVVAPGTGRVTLTARPTDPAAQVQYGPETDASTAPGHQAALPLGLTTRLTATAVSASGGESMLYTVDVTRPATDLCGRTPEVRDAILAKLSDVTDCVAVTAAHLAGGLGRDLDLSDEGITALKAGGFRRANEYECPASQRQSLHTPAARDIRRSAGTVKFVSRRHRTRRIASRPI